VYRCRDAWLKHRATGITTGITSDPLESGGILVPPDSALPLISPAAPPQTNGDRLVQKSRPVAVRSTTPHRDEAVARCFLRRAIDRRGHPKTITIDKSGANTAAIVSEQQRPRSAHRFASMQIAEQQHYRPGSSRNQTHHQADGVLQVVTLRTKLYDWHRDGA
jgi:hypothetical protein